MLTAFFSSFDLRSQNILLGWFFIAVLFIKNIFIFCKCLISLTKIHRQREKCTDFPRLKSEEVHLLPLHAKRFFPPSEIRFKVLFSHLKQGWGC